MKRSFIVWRTELLFIQFIDGSNGLLTRKSRELRRKSLRVNPACKRIPYIALQLIDLDVHYARSNGGEIGGTYRTHASNSRVGSKLCIPLQLLLYYIINTNSRAITMKSHSKQFKFSSLLVLSYRYRT